MVETWKRIQGHPDYEVSDQGRVRSFKKPGQPRLMRFRADRYGHLRLELDGVTRKVHQLVANAFIPLPSQHLSGCDAVARGLLCICSAEPLCVRHLNDDKNDNRAINLCWGTYSQNLIDSYTNGRRPSKKHGTP